MRKLRNLAITVVVLLLSWLVMPASLQTTIANNAADMSGKIVMVADSATGRTVTNLFTFDRGAAVPFAVGASSLKVTGLDADKLDGLDSVRYRQITAVTTSTGTQNNFDPSGNIAAGYQIVIIYANNASLLTVTGFAAGVFDGQAIWVLGQNSEVDFAHQNAGSTASGRIINAATSGVTPITLAGWAHYIYDNTNARWRLDGHDQGGWITPTYAAGTYTATGGGTWTVDSGDVGTYKYRLSGKTLSLFLQLDTTSITGTVNIVAVTLPNSYTTAATVTTPFLLFDNSATVAVAASMRAASAGTTVQFQFLNTATNFTASANLTYLRGGMTFEVN